MTFTPKDVETLKTEALEDLGLDAYEGNEDVVDRVVARLKGAEDLKKSLHDDKMSNRDKLKETRKLAGLDPETGEKIQTNVVEPKNDGLSFKDVIAARDLAEEDVDFVASEAKLRGISFAEAKALPLVKSALRDLAEQRKTAEATNTGKDRNRNIVNTDEAIIKSVEAGKIPDTDEDMAKYVQAKHNAKIAAFKARS